MTPTELLDSLATRGIGIMTAGGQILVKPAAALTPTDLQAIRQHKAELIALLNNELLTPIERQELMAETAERCHQSWQGQPIDFATVDRISANIGRTFTRQELVALLAEYVAAILAGGSTQ